MGGDGRDFINLCRRTADTAHVFKKAALFDIKYQKILSGEMVLVVSMYPFVDMRYSWPRRSDVIRRSSILKNIKMSAL